MCSIARSRFPFFCLSRETVNFPMLLSDPSLAFKRQFAWCVYVCPFACACFPCLLSSWPPLLSLLLINIWIPPPPLSTSGSEWKDGEREGRRSRRKQRRDWRERKHDLPSEKCLPNTSYFLQRAGVLKFKLKDSHAQKIRTRMCCWAASTVPPCLAPHSSVWTSSPKAHPACCVDSVVLRHHQSLAQPCVGPPAARRALALHPVCAGVCLSDHPVCCPLPTTGERGSRLQLPLHHFSGFPVFFQDFFLLRSNEEILEIVLPSSISNLKSADHKTFSNQGSFRGRSWALDWHHIVLISRWSTIVTEM